MSILRDFPIHLSPEEVVRAQQPKRRSVSPALLAAAREAVALGETLIEPAAACDVFPVREVLGERVVLEVLSSRVSEEEGTWLTVGHKAELLAPAQQVMAAVYTVGPALESRVHELSRAGNELLAFMLDSVGVLALGAVGEALRVRVEEQAAALGWGVSPALSPGSLVGWALQGQRELCALLPLDAIGVRLTDCCVMEPHKSVSLVVGMGPGYDSAHVGSVCSYCSLAERCWRRRNATA